MPEQRGKTEEGYELDCYPYTFSPLLLFAQESYFDKGHSNYNSVAQVVCCSHSCVDGWLVTLALEGRCWWLGAPTR